MLVPKHYCMKMCRKMEIIMASISSSPDLSKCLSSVRAPFIWTRPIFRVSAIPEKLHKLMYLCSVYTDSMILKFITGH